MVVVRGFHPHPGLPPSRGKGVFGLCLVGVSSPSWSFAVEGGGRFCAGMVVVRGFHPHPGLPPSRGKGLTQVSCSYCLRGGWVCFCGNDNVKTSPPSWPSPVEGEGSFWASAWLGSSSPSWSFAVEGGGRFCAGNGGCEGTFHPHPGLPPSRGKGVFGLCLAF